MKKKEFLEKLYNLKNQIWKTRESLNLAKLEEQLENLEKKTQKVDFWQEKDSSQVMEKIKNLKNYLKKWHDITSEIEEIINLLKMAYQENDHKMILEIEERTNKLIKKFDQLEIEFFFSGKYDRLNALLSIHSGTGGIEAQDWAEMLMRMYIRYAQKKGFEVKILEIIKGEEAGIKSVTLEVSGFFAYGYLKGESGVHRLVRLSPFDADHARHTSFALIEIIPLLEEEEFEIEPSEIKIETFKSSGPGGQHAQKTESAVRITHLKTGITASCQNERSQYQNKITALRILKSKLAHLKEKEEKGKISKIIGEVLEASWGNQIRSYVFHPYNLVKDHRTGFKTSDTKSVLNGELTPFIESYLRKR